MNEARAVLLHADDAVKKARSAAGGTQGEIHVGYAPSLTVQILPQTLRIFQGNFPNVRVALHDLSTEEMLALLETAPERFSPNVALRPVVQQTLFPAAACVAGPGEIAYWAQLKPVFDHHGVTMPVIWPRSRAVRRAASTMSQRYAPWRGSSQAHGQRQ